MEAQTDLVLTHDRSRVVPLGDPDGNPLAWVASKGEEVPGIAEANPEVKAEPKAKAPSATKQRKPDEDK
jgi:hypothetical protein